MRADAVPAKRETLPYDIQDWSSQGTIKIGGDFEDADDREMEFSTEELALEHVFAIVILKYLLALRKTVGNLVVERRRRVVLICATVTELGSTGYVLPLARRPFSFDIHLSFPPSPLFSFLSFSL